MTYWELEGGPSSGGGGILERVQRLRDRLLTAPSWISLRTAAPTVRRTATSLALSVLLLLPASAGKFEGGLDALHKGYFREAVRDFSDAVTEGHHRASLYLGLMAWHGVGMNADRNAAVRYFSFSAEQGDPVAQYYLGTLYQDDFGLLQLQRSARAGFAPAQVDLGLRYHSGQGVTKDFEQAAYWYDRAAEAGEPRAFDRLAVMHYYGQWFPQNNNIATYNAIIAARLFESEKFRSIQRKNLAAFTKNMKPTDAALIQFSAAERANELLRDNQAGIRDMLYMRALLGSDFSYMATKQPSLVGGIEATNLLSFLERGMAYYLTGRCDDAQSAFEKADERREGEGRARAYLNRMDQCQRVPKPQGN